MARFLTPAVAGMLLLTAFPIAAAEGDDPGVTIAIDSVLALGPLPVDTGLLDDADKVDELQRALITQFERQPMAREGASVTVFGEELIWRTTTTTDAGQAGSVWLWAVNLEADRFVRGHLQPRRLEEASVFLAGRRIEAGEAGHELDLRNGTHTVWIVHRGAAGDEPPALVWTGRKAHDRVSAHLDPARRVSPERLTNAETVTNLAISPDGRSLALAFDSRDDSAEVDIRRLEIRNLESGRIEQQWSGSRPASLAWSPDGRFLAVQEADNLWLHRTDGGRARLLLANHEDLGDWRWHPDSGSIVFAWTEKFEDDNGKSRRLRALEDRWANFRDNRQLYQVDAASGVVRPLTASDRSVTLHDISPDGERLLLTESVIDYAEPPHGLTRLFELELAGLDEREITRLRLFDGIRYAEDGYWLLAGPGLPIGDGATTAEDVTPNEYDTQLYRMDTDGTTARSLSRDLGPAFSGIHRLADGNLLLPAVEGEYGVLIHFDAAEDRFTKIDTGVEVVESFVASEQASPVVVVRGSDADAPQRVHRVDLERNRNEVMIDTRQTEYADVELGEVRPWSFVNAAGDEIEGRYYLPPDFDADETYPLIVYYYGGIVPVNRQFTGRYPFNLWAAQDYVIYVLQPRGSIGYGQDFSALHVNAWGEYSADDIIEGTEKFVAAHDFVDGERIGNIGASYGGFMTMYLATKSDIFTASISHAGISALTSYWGEGWWGYAYSGIASKGSFPWNNRELYVEHSPVYNADKITTPLLLLTGDSDTNVPPGESHNMYTALKLLGRDVELVEFPGEDHWILDREKRYVWWDTILAWFDHHLKDEPEWWRYLYPETGE